MSRISGKRGVLSGILPILVLCAVATVGETGIRTELLLLEPRESDPPSRMTAQQQYQDPQQYQQQPQYPAQQQYQDPQQQQYQQQQYPAQQQYQDPQQQQQYQQPQQYPAQQQYQDPQQYQQQQQYQQPQQSPGQQQYQQPAAPGQQQWTPPQMPVPPPAGGMAGGFCAVKLSTDRSTIHLVDASGGTERKHVSLGQDRIQKVFNSPDGTWSVAIYKIRGAQQYGFIALDLAKCEDQLPVEVPSVASAAAFDQGEVALTFETGEKRYRLKNQTIQ